MGGMRTMARTGRFPGFLALHCCFFGIQVDCAAASSAAAATKASAGEKLVQALDAALVEEDARKLLEPHLDNLKSLDSQAVEKVVTRQWWALSRDLVAKSHTQQVDFSFAVRKAVRTLKDEADELLRTLNPKYGLAQQVSPAFQWAQNDTSIFLTIKYTVRWNAPGALEVTEPSVNMSSNIFNFSGLGKHSNNKYRYWLSLSLFDRIDGEQSSWSTASVGKLSVTLRKKWARKWPRLITNKKAKIGNMHVWSERQESLDFTLSGMSTVSNSPVTCAAAEKLYCLATDTCKKAENCSQCPGKTTAKEEEQICTGRPTEKAGVSFKDGDMDEGELGGEVKITKAKNDFDIDAYDVFFGKDDHSKLELPDGSFARLGTAVSTGADTEVKMPPNSRIPEGATHLLVYSTNAFGEYGSPGSTLLTDAVLPKGKPTSLEFEDEDGDLGEVSGTVTIGKAEDEDKLEEYSLHWGKSDKKKIGSSSFIRDVRKYGESITHILSANTKIPEGASHLLVFSKNSHGENPTAASIKIADQTRPCLASGSPDCPVQVASTPDADQSAKQVQTTLAIQRAAKEEKLTHYSLYWGRKACSEAGGGQSGAKNGHIGDLPVGTASGEERSKKSLEHELPAGSPVPDGTTHVLVFTKNKYGESDACASTEFKDKAGAEEQPEL